MNSSPTHPTTMSNVKAYKMLDNNSRIYHGKCTMKYLKRKICGKIWLSNGWLSKVVTFYWTSIKCLSGKVSAMGNVQKRRKLLRWSLMQKCWKLYGGWSFISFQSFMDTVWVSAESLFLFLFSIAGSLIQVPPGKGKFRSRLASFKSEREAVRQCFLFSNNMIIATRWVELFSFGKREFKVLFSFRTSGGRLHLLEDIGKIPLADATLIEDPSDSEREDDGKPQRIVSLNHRLTLEFSNQQAMLTLFHRKRCRVASAWTMQTAQAIVISRFWLIQKLASGISCILWRPLCKRRRLGSATYLNASTTFTCIQCYRQEVASDPQGVRTLNN